MAAKAIYFKQKYGEVRFEARQFMTNNEVGSPHMDSLVNWMNQGRDECRAWHNGTDIFVFRPFGGWDRVTLGYYILCTDRRNGVFEVINPGDLYSKYEEIGESDR